MINLWRTFGGSDSLPIDRQCSEQCRLTVDTLLLAALSLLNSKTNMSRVKREYIDDRFTERANLTFIHLYKHHLVNTCIIIVYILTSNFQHRNKRISVSLKYRINCTVNVRKSSVNDKCMSILNVLLSRHNQSGTFVRTCYLTHNNASSSTLSPNVVSNVGRYRKARELLTFGVATS